ncbi:MAG: EamA family transporter [Gammaproteobacteria bacterium]|nr:EamA family transporter [Gammaproteobacteria bacterium]
MTSPNTTSLSVLAVVLGALILGATTAALREIDVGSTAAGFWRVALALPVLLGIAALRTRDQNRPRALPSRPQWRLLLIAGACFAGDLVFWHLALVNTSLGNATFLATLSSLWVPLVAFCFLRQRLSKRFALGLICALTGSGILVSAHLGVGTSSSSSWVGDAYGLLTGFFFTGYILAVGYCRESLTTADTMLYSSALCAAFLLPLAIAAQVVAGETLLPSSATGWLSVFALALLAHLVGQGLVAFGVGQLSASLAAVILCLEGVGAMTVGALFYAETRDAWDLGAIVLIVTGIALAQRDASG